MTDLTKEFDAIQQKVDRLQKLADCQVQPPMKFKPYTKIEDNKYKWSNYDNMWGTFNLKIDYYFWSSRGWANKNVTQESLQKALDKFKSTKQHWIEDNKEIYEYNLAVSEHNKIQRERVDIIMSTIGVRKTFSRSYFKTSRSTKMTTETTPAKWPSEVADVLPINCGYNEIIKKIDERFEKIKTTGEKWIKEEQERLAEEAAEKAAKEKEQRKIKIVAGLCIKYGLDLESDPEDIRDAILGKDKYLKLAHYLERNRNDWNDGYSYAEYGLNSFEVVTEKDEEIYQEISSLFEDFCDGRVFRDCTWSYSTLYGEADAELYNDYVDISEYVSEY